MPPIRKTNWKKQIHRGNQTKLNWTDVEAHLTQQIQHISQAIDFDFDEDPLGDHAKRLHCSRRIFMNCWRTDVKCQSVSSLVFGLD